ncbi:hypothetical protein [Heliorestis acidaminivorans]|uniref:hypothetical protein n=1 Tax=Heliorestis acidaminivorans TaxID=553427 RepID=UPI001A9BEE98
MEQFEKAVAQYCGDKLACLSSDLGPSDLNWTSPNIFVASANCALYCGANVDFVDIGRLRTT